MNGNRSLAAVRVMNLAILVAMVSCGPASHTQMGGLGDKPSLVPSKAETSSAETGLVVLFSTPTGEVAGQPEIAVSFSKPMKLIGKADDDPHIDGLVPFKITPKIEGEFRWMGSRTVHFAPDDPIPQATKFSLMVPEGLRSLTGQRLEKTHTWSFTTPPPNVETTEPYSGEMWAKPESTITLYFNQKVDPAVVQSRARLIVAGKDVAFDVKERKGSDPKAVVVTPKKKLPLDSSVTLRVESGLVGREGPIPMDESFSLSFRTYGPLAIKQFSCWSDDDKTPEIECDPEDGVTVEMTNPVPTEKLEKLVGIKPVVKDAQYDKWSKYSRWIEITPASHWKPGADYVMTLSKKLVDEFGQKITGDRQIEFVTRDFSPRWRLKFDGNLLEAGSSKVLPVSVLNVEDLEVWMKRVDEQKDVVPMLEKLRRVGSMWLRTDKETVKEKLSYKKVLNSSVPAKIDLARAGGDKQGGIVIVRVQNGDSEYDWESRVVRISNLGITAKVSGEKVVAWVTNLAKGEPAVGVDVTIRSRANKVLWTGKTDVDGLVTVAGSELWDDWYALGWDDRCPYVFASQGTDFNHVNACGEDQVSSWNFDVYHNELAGQKRLSGIVFSDRGAYRPGEKVRLKSILRWLEKGKLSPPAGQKFQFTVNDSRGDEVLQKVVTVNEFGGLHMDVPLSPASRLGYWSVYVTPEGGDDTGRETLHGSFRVEEYRAPSFRVEVKPEHKEVVSGHDAGFKALGEYLFGAPMGGAMVSWDASGSSGWFHPSGWDEWVFSDASHYHGYGWEDPHYGLSHSGQGMLDSGGALVFGFATDIEELKGPVDFAVESTVTGPDLQRVSGHSRVRVHPASVYAGIKSQESIIKAGKTFHAAVAVVDLAGEPVSGRPVKISLIKRQWQYVQSEGMYDDSYGDWKVSDTKVASCKKISGNKPVTCGLKIPGPGRFILRATTSDAKGRKTASSMGIWAWGAGSVSWQGANELVVDMHTDKDVYAVGDTARILVENPFEKAEALVTVEHHGIREVRKLSFTDRAATIEVPIADDMRPNVYVSVALVRGRTKAAPKKGGTDAGKPSVRMGYVNLEVGIEDRSLDVAIESGKKKYGPGDKVDIDLQVTDHAGKPKKSEVTLFVVDEAVLMLTGYTAPDPLGHFYKARELGVSTSDSRMSILTRRAFGTDKGDVGGGGWSPPAGTEVRQDFRTTVLFLPDLVTDDEGRASASFDLPDGLTTYRIMAVASSRDDCFGRGNQSITVSKPLLIKPALPRFLRVGDHFEAGVILHDGGDGGGDVTVTAGAEGLVLDGLAKKVVALPDGGSVPVTFSFRAEKKGDAELTFGARKGKQSDAIRITKPVLLPTVIETVATYGDTTDSAVEGIGMLEGVRDDSGGLTVRMSSTAMVGMDRAVESLVRYPYGCAEQLTSRMVPMVALGEVLETFDMGVEFDEKKLAETVGQIQDMQHYSGGWGYFSGANCPYPYLSAYVLWGLHQASERGYAVDETVMDRGKYFLRRVLRDEHWCSTMPDWWWSNVGLTTKTYILYVLASMNASEPSYNDYLYEKRGDLPLFSQLLLASAIHRSGGNDAHVEELLRDALNNVKQTPSSAHLTENLGDGYQWIMHSEVRATAMALSVLLEVDPEHMLVSKMARWLMDARREDGTWGTTQNDAWALLAMTQYLKIKEAEEPDFEASVLMGGTTLLQTTFEGRDLEEQKTFLSMQKLLSTGPGAVQFDMDGDGRLYYSASLSYARDSLPPEPIDRGFFIERQYVAFTPTGTEILGGPSGLGKVQSGTSVLVNLTIVVTGKRHFVAVEDPLPAGLEPVNLNFNTSSHADAELIGSSMGPWYAQPFYHTEMHDDRVVLFADSLQPGIYHYSYLARATTVGEFVVAPAKAHEMYHPEVYGRTGAGMFTID